MQATFCFVDLAGFTALTETHGDHAAADLLARFHALVDGAVADHATVADMIGDAAFLVAEHPEAMARRVPRLWQGVLEEHDFPTLHAGLRSANVRSQVSRGAARSRRGSVHLAAPTSRGKALRPPACSADQRGVPSPKKTHPAIRP